MAEAGARDTLQPALLDRLTDNDPTRKVEGRQERVISRTQLRASVLRDLSSLFNTTNVSGEIDLSAYPLVAQSTVNYGMTPLSRYTSVLSRSSSGYGWAHNSPLISKDTTL